MKRLISFICVCCTLFSSISSAFVKRDIDIICEKVIPFSFTANESKLEEYINLKNYSDVKIIDYYTDNGEIEVEIDNTDAKLLLYDGEYTNGYKTITKIGNLEIEEELTNEKNKIILIDAPENITNIQEVGGDFESAKLIQNNKIELTVSQSAKGNIFESENETITSEIKVEVDSTNTKREVYSDYYMANGDILGIESIKIVNGNAEVEMTGNKLRVFFSDGTPKLNESTQSDNYSYFWADRASDGSFKKEYPNSIYRSDRKYFTGEGEYIEGDKAIKELAQEIEKNLSWKDYAGVVIDGVKYMYLYNDEVENLDFKDREILTENKLVLDGQWCNAEQLIIEFEDDVIRYTPNGKLYSVGDLIENTKGWGTIVNNQPDESKEEFFNEIRGETEPYVRHFKFFFGPSKKTTFGGYFTYPYNAIIEYEYYKPITKYSGDILYTYEEEEKFRGYNYNGWIKIRYSDSKNVNDYPPSSPYNVRYDKKLIWNSGNDDYTPQEELKYEIEVKIEELWQKVSVTDKGITQVDYDNGQDLSFRVRTIDETGQVSEWAYSDKSEMKLFGNAEPKVIKQGETLDIEANTKSLSNIVKVEAICETLGINKELNKISEIQPNYNEISFDVWCAYEKDKYINTDNDMWSYNNGKKDVIDSYLSKALTDNHMLTVNLPDVIEINKSGTVVLPNGNYLNSPIDFFKLGSKWWQLKSWTILDVKNKNTTKNENFIYLYNSAQTVNVNGKKVLQISPYIKLNTFSYDESGNTEFVKIPIDKNIASEPIAIVWDTYNEVVDFNIYFGNTLAYIHRVNIDDIQNNVCGFSRYRIGKQLEEVRKTNYGFLSKGNSYDWPKIKLVGSFEDLIWLGYKFKSNLYDEDYFEEYNNFSTTRNVNRLLFLDKSVETFTIKKYLDLIRNTNLSLESRDKNTILAKNVREKNCKFKLDNISTNKNSNIGMHTIRLIAYAENGETAFSELTVRVIGDEKKSTKQAVNIGRFFYNEGRECVEDLNKLLKDNLSEGFLSAGETLGVLIQSDADYIEIDIEGDKSVKNYDVLTKRFLEDEPLKRGENVENIDDNYKFPKIIYPVSINQDGSKNFIWLYKIPYRTQQTLESWSTIREKSGDSENIDKNKLFDRIAEPYELVIRENGQTNNNIIKFDVFERWDTILNRNVSAYLSNYSEKWRIEF